MTTLVSRREELFVASRPDGEVVVTHVHAAFSFARRLRGLIGLKRLPGHSALWLNPGGSVHTCGMRIVIDVVFLDRDFRVLAIHPHVRPWQCRLAPWHTRSTLELASGCTASLGLRIGDRLRMRPRDTIYDANRSTSNV